MKVVKVTESASGQTVFLLKRSGRERRVDLAFAVVGGFAGVAAFLYFVYVIPPSGCLRNRSGFKDGDQGLKVGILHEHFKDLQRLRS